MKPIPSANIPTSGNTGGKMPSIPTAIPQASGPYSTSNRKTGAHPTQRAYPWLLFTSTSVAAVFCLLYITKPVILTTPGSSHHPTESETPSLTATQPRPPAPGLLPQGNSLPGEISPASKSATLPSGSDSGFEESNLRVQHVLAAETPDGALSRIVLDIPVLYQSRNLRWTEADVATARQLLHQLVDHQEKNRTLRTEGIALLDAWNSLIERSIPSQDLRADSPSLPTNQGDASLSPRPANLNTKDAIRLHTDE